MLLDCLVDKNYLSGLEDNHVVVILCFTIFPLYTHLYNLSNVEGGDWEELEENPWSSGENMDWSSLKVSHHVLQRKKDILMSLKDHYGVWDSTKITNVYVNLSTWATKEKI